MGGRPASGRRWPGGCRTPPAEPGRSAQQRREQLAEAVGHDFHADRGEDENLSAPGSLYVPLAFGPSTQLPQLGVRPGASEPNRFYMYGVVGRLAMLAGSYELESTDPLADDSE